MTEISVAQKTILANFEEKSGLVSPEVEFVQKNNGPVMVIKVAHPTERLFRILEDARTHMPDSPDEVPLATLARKSGGNLLTGPEGQMFLRTLSESLNINRYSFGPDFRARYTRPVFGAESQVISAANHVVYGRRGAGKSMLLLYALHDRQQSSKPYAWIDMQVYARRADAGVVADIVVALLEQVAELLKEPSEQIEHIELVKELRGPDVSATRVRQILPRLRRLLGKVGARGDDLFVFLDDFHVVDRAIQPTLLDILYGLSRGNRIHLKLSAIETLTRTFDASEKVGLEIPHDAQVIRLDYNLTIPDRATEHIDAILNSQAQYSGLPSVRRLCTSNDVVPRLTWVAAGVPRDALYLFSQAMTKASLGGRNRVTVSNINHAASEALTIKQRDLESDLSEGAGDLTQLVERLRDFCVARQRRNAFLVEIKAEQELFERIRTLVDLRLLHVINEGVTIGEVGRKYLALILDYGFYTGIRAAKSVDLFNKQSGRVAYRDLRKLPVFVG